MFVLLIEISYHKYIVICFYEVQILVMCFAMNVLLKRGLAIVQIFSMKARRSSCALCKKCVTVRSVKSG